MGLENYPEVKMARKIIKKHSLSVPFDLDSLIGQYAKIIYKSIPIEGVDGICLNLKTPNKTPTVIVNSDSTRRRQKFTLAHELGHIIIPWHLGNFIDYLGEDTNKPNNQYWDFEREANRFASELLMPFDWIYSLYKKNSDRFFLISQICEYCGVSEMAASIRLTSALSEIETILIPIDWLLELYLKIADLAKIQKVIVESTNLESLKVASYMCQHLPGSIAFCMESQELVIRCGSTRNTHSHHQFEGDEFLKTPYSFYKSYTIYHSHAINTHWWVLEKDFEIPFDNRDWRTILDIIATEIPLPLGIKNFKATVNGKMSGANGNFKRKNSAPNINVFMKEAIQRFDNPQFKDFVNHTDFLAFIRKRSEAFFNM